MNKILLAALFIARASWAAVTLDSVDTANFDEGTAGSITFSHTCTGTSTNGLLVVVVATRIKTNDAAVVTGVTYNGTSMTLFASTKAFDSSQGASITRADMFYMLAPPTGTHDVVVSKGQIYTGASAVSFTNVDQTTPFTSTGAVTFTDETTTAVSQTLSSGAGDMGVDVYSLDEVGGCSSGTPGAGQTSFMNDCDGFGRFLAGASYLAAAGSSLTMAWDGSLSGLADPSYLMAVVKAASGGGVTNVYPSTFTGVSLKGVSVR